jgi:hypothetical protein
LSKGLQKEAALYAPAWRGELGATDRRVQFTPDQLPADITSFNVYNQQTGQFIFQSAPVIANILLADEINRTIPRIQSSLLESIEERQVTVDRKTYPLPHPFFAMATRDYPIGQPAKYVHWKASPRHHRLQQKIFEPSEKEKILSAVDMDQFTKNKAEEEFEQTLEEKNPFLNSYSFNFSYSVFWPLSDSPGAGCAAPYTGLHS